VQHDRCKLRVPYEWFKNGRLVLYKHDWHPNGAIMATRELLHTMLHQETRTQVLREIIRHFWRAEATSKLVDGAGAMRTMDSCLCDYGLDRLLSVLTQRTAREFLSTRLKSTKNKIHSRSNMQANTIMANLGRLRGGVVVTERLHQNLKDSWMKADSNAVFAIDALAWVHGLVNNAKVPFEICRSEECYHLCNVVRECADMSHLLLDELQT